MNPFYHDLYDSFLHHDTLKWHYGRWVWSLPQFKTVTAFVEEHYEEFFNRYAVRSDEDT